MYVPNSNNFETLVAEILKTLENIQPRLQNKMFPYKNGLVYWSNATVLFVPCSRAKCQEGSGTSPILVNVHMETGKIENTWIDSLHAAFAGVQVWLSGCSTAPVRTKSYCFMHFIHLTSHVRK